MLDNILLDTRVRVEEHELGTKSFMFLLSLMYLSESQICQENFAH